MRQAALLATLGLMACQSRSSPRPGTASTAPTSPPQMRVTLSEPFRPVQGDSALRAFLPAVPAVESGGECRLVRTSGSGATMVTAAFPSFDSSKNNVTLSFDSARHLVRYSDIRGSVRFTFPPGMTDAQRDSARRAALEKTARTSISLDWSVDQALASNRRADGTEAVIASVREMENLEKFGPPARRIAHVRRLCGV